MLVHLSIADVEELLHEIVSNFLQVHVPVVGAVLFEDNREQLVCEEVEGLAKACTQRVLMARHVFCRVVTVLHGVA